MCPSLKEVDSLWTMTRFFVTIWNICSYHWSSSKTFERISKMKREMWNEYSTVQVILTFPSFHISSKSINSVFPDVCWNDLYHFIHIFLSSVWIMSADHAWVTNKRHHAMINDVLLTDLAINGTHGSLCGDVFIYYIQTDRP